MSKTFTCRELGGICDESFSGNSLMEIIQKGMQHIASDDTHKEHVATLEERTGENQQQWIARVQGAFNIKEED